PYTNKVRSASSLVGEAESDSESIQERLEMQRVLATMPNRSVAPSASFTDSIQERLEVQGLLKEQQEHNSGQAGALSKPANLESIAERLEVQRIGAMMLEQ
ncbi:MAG: hypothetical protein ACE5Q6_25695, partial [Dehalococcoidia bacterium]